MYKRRKKQCICSVCILGLVLWLFWGNYSIEVTKMIIKDEHIPETFNNFKIVQISDLHNVEFGEGQKKLLKKINDADPDIIVITGDLIDSIHTDIEKAIKFVEGAIRIAPVYFVTGNHEAWLEKYEELEVQLIQTGVIVLDDKAITFERGESILQLIGVNDPDFILQNEDFDKTNALFDKKLQDMVDMNSNYKILLSHRPELIDIYSHNNIDLVFSGHAHGGQFRFPFLGGLVAPNQGLFPEYTEGKYVVDQTEMIVSRGLGNSIIPFRINNRPEMIIVELNHVEKRKYEKKENF